MKIIDLAKIVYQANKAYCETINYPIKMHWDILNNEGKKSIEKGVRFHLNNPYATPEDSHVEWMISKIEKGWSFGSFNNDNKTHPCIKSYDLLPKEQKIKDLLFKRVVNALSSFIEEDF